MVHSVRKWLLPFSALYGGIVTIRNFGYDNNIFSTKKLPVPVVSVGNISVGGSGKTPFVLYLIERLLSMGKKPAVLSLGYKRLTGERRVSCPNAGEEVDVQLLGDEPALISRSYPNVPVAVHKNRHASGLVLLDKFDIDVFVLDDGLQNRELNRDLDFVLMNHALDDLYDSYLPAGNVRDRKGRIRQADVIVLTGHSQFTVDATVLSEVHSCANAPVAGISFTPSSLVNSLGEDCDLMLLQGSNVAAFCGIARSDGFFVALEELGYSISRRKVFGDHHWFDEYDLDEIFQGDEETLAVTTMKDAIRIFGDEELVERDDVKRIYGLRERATVNFGEEHINAALLNLFERAYA